MPTIIFDDVTKFFQHSRQTKVDSTLALDCLKLKVKSGELIALLGPSGCGKTTTLRMLAGFISPDRGRIVVNNHVISTSNKSLSPQKRNMSMIFQNYAIWPHLTVFENVAFGLRLRKLRKPELTARVMQALKQVRLEELADRRPTALSGGQQQRVSLARAVVVEPKILLLDEPLSNLDASLRDAIGQEIVALHRQLNLTTVYVTHDQKEALSLSDRVVVMDRGKIQQVGTPQEIYQNPETRFVADFIGENNLLYGQVFSRNSIWVSNILFQVEYIAQHISIGDRVAICLRHHSISISSSNRQIENHLQAKVEACEYLGDLYKYKLLALKSNICLTVTTQPHVRLQPGSVVDLSIAPSSFQIFKL